MQADNKLAGRPNTRHIGAPFANAWVYNTLESMCVAQMVDRPATKRLPNPKQRSKNDRRVDRPNPQCEEPDGYLQTAYTIHGHRRWSNKHDHEGYNAGYFLEAAMAHYLMTGGSDSRLYDAAKRLADCSWLTSELGRDNGTRGTRSWSRR